MSEWVDFVVYAALIVALWFVLPTWSSRFTLPFVADRNPGWLNLHPEVAKQLTGSGWFVWVYYAWGALSLPFCWRSNRHLAADAVGLRGSTPMGSSQRRQLGAARSRNHSIGRGGCHLYPLAAEDRATCRASSGDAGAAGARRLRPSMAPDGERMVSSESFCWRG